MAEQVIRSRDIYRGKVINLRIDDVSLPNQQMVIREIVEHRGAVAIVAIDAQDRVLMVRQYRSAAAQELLEIPAGTLEQGEDPTLAAPRELKEETGSAATEWIPLGRFYSSPGFSTEEMYLYLARNLTLGEASPEEDEAITLEKVPLREALEKIDRGEIIDAKSIVGLLRVWRQFYSHTRP